MAIASRNTPLSKPRPFWVQTLNAVDRRSYLIEEYLNGVMERRERKEAASVRAFLVAWSRVTQGNNPMELQIRVAKESPGLAVVHVFSPYAGVVTWLPTLVLPWTDRFYRIDEECGGEAHHTTSRPRSNHPREHVKRAPSRPPIPVQIVRAVTGQGSLLAADIILAERAAAKRAKAAKNAKVAKKSVGDRNW